MPKLTARIALSFALLSTIACVSLLLTPIARADTPPTQDALPGANPTNEQVSGNNGILTGCDPTSTSIKNGEVGCGVDDAMQLIYNIIHYVTYIIIPIAVLLLGYAGFTIMTSAGSTEKMSEAKKTFKLVAIGLAIIFGASLMVQYIFTALKVPTTGQDKPNITNVEPGTK